MNIPPLSAGLSIACRNLSHARRDIRLVFGYMWKTIFHMPIQLFHLCEYIYEFVKKCFNKLFGLPQSATAAQIKPSTSIKPWEKHPLQIQNEKELSQKKGRGKGKAISSHSKETLIKFEIPSCKFKSEKDPLIGLGDLVPSTNEKIPGMKDQQAANKKGIDKKILESSIKLAQSVQDLLKEIDVKKLNSWQDYSSVIDQIDKKLTEIQLNANLFQIPKVLNPIQSNLKDLNIKANVLKEEMCAKFDCLDTAQKFTKPAQDLLKEMDVNKPSSWQEYLKAMDQIEKHRMGIQIYLSKFKNFMAHAFIQATLKNLENKANVLEEEIGAKLKNQYKPNPNIGGQGDCLFKSIDAELKKGKNPSYYRKLAAGHIRKNAQAFFDDVMDACKQEEKIIKAYLIKRGGVDVWVEEEKAKIGYEPTKMYLYCDCLENSNLCGGVIEIYALSAELKVPILVISKQDDGKWKLVMKRGESTFADKPPIWLFYNGVDHYQNLISV